MAATGDRHRWDWLGSLQKSPLPREKTEPREGTVFQGRRFTRWYVAGMAATHPVTHPPPHSDSEERIAGFFQPARGRVI